MSNSVRYFVFDIETVADGRLIQRSRYADQPELSPTDAIAKYKEELLEQSGGKSDFIPHTYQLPISIAICGLDAQFHLVGFHTLDRPKFRPHIITQKFWESWLARSMPCFVTFNGRGFDLPVMEMCAFRYGIQVPAWFNNQGPSYNQARNRFNSNSHFDIMEFLTNSGASRLTGGLDLCSTILGKPGKMDTKGSMVQELWDAGKKEEIDDYCLCDALDTYFSFLRCQLLLGNLNRTKEFELVSAAHKKLIGAKEENPALEKYLKNFKFWDAPSEIDSGFLS